MSLMIILAAFAQQPAGAGPSAPDPESWVRAMVDLADTGGPFKQERDCGDFLRQAGGAIDDDATRDSQSKVCFCYDVADLGEDDITMFVNAGYDALPLLMPHIWDDRATGWTFNRPLSSFDDTEPKMVGQVACYLIEAILRKNPYFVRSFRFQYEPPPGCSESEAERYALHRAASAYDRWYDQCFDEETHSVTCPREQLPEVKWDYDLEAWGRYLNLDFNRQDRAVKELLGRTVVGSRTGQRGYLLVLSGDAWLSCFVSTTDSDGLDWHYGLGRPDDDEIAMLGPAQPAGLAADLPAQVAKAHGKSLNALDLDETIWPVFADGSTLWASVVYDPTIHSRILHAYWGMSEAGR